MTEGHSSEFGRVVLENLPRVFPDGSFLPDGEFSVLNPHRDDRNLGSLKINPNTGKWKDFAPGAPPSPTNGIPPSGANVTSLYAYVHDVTYQEADDKLTARLEGIESSVRPQREKDEGELVTPVPQDEIPSVFHFQGRASTRRWTYKNADGGVLGWDVRFDYPDGSKSVITFTYRRYADGSTRISSNGGFGIDHRPLFNLDLLAERPDATVVVVEGCKTAEATQSLFDTIAPGSFVATTSPGGSGAAHHADWSPINGRRVVILPDHDGNGLSYANDVARILLQQDRNRSIHVVSYDGLHLPEKWDLANLDPNDTDLVAAVVEKIQSSRDVRDYLRTPVEGPRRPLLSPDADYGVLGEVIEMYGEDTEADPAAILIHLIVYAGVLIGGGPFIRVNETKHHCNLFAVVVGDTAAGRKGTANDIAAAVMEAVTRELGGTPFHQLVMRGVVSGEAIIHMVRDETYLVEKATRIPTPTGSKSKTTSCRMPRTAAIAAFGNACLPEEGDLEILPDERIITVVDQGVKDKRAVMLETEFSRFLKICGRQGSTLNDTSREAWDHPEVLQVTAKQTGECATGAHIGCVGHITGTDLRQCLSDGDLLTGFANRFLWVYSRSQRVVPDPPQKDVTEVATKIADAIRFASSGIREMKRSADAEALWASERHSRDSRNLNLGDAEVAANEKIPTDRWMPQVLRLSAVFALLDKSVTIEVKHLRTAFAVWDYCQNSAEVIFGSPGPRGRVESKILDALRESYPQPLAKTDLHEATGRNTKAPDLDAAIDRLANRGLIRIHRKTGKGGGELLSADPLSARGEFRTFRTFRTPQASADGGGKGATSFLANVELNICKYRKTDTLADWCHSRPADVGSDTPTNSTNCTKTSPAGPAISPDDEVLL